MVVVSFRPDPRNIPRREMGFPVQEEQPRARAGLFGGGADAGQMTRQRQRPFLKADAEFLAKVDPWLVSPVPLGEPLQ